MITERVFEYAQDKGGICTWLSLVSQITGSCGSGAIFHSKVNLVLIRGTLTARRNVNDILSLVLLSFSRYSGLTFQEDNTRPCTAIISTDFFMLTEHFPGQLDCKISPPPPNIWGGLMIRHPRPFRDLADLTRQCERVQEVILQDAIHQIYMSVPGITTCQDQRNKHLMDLFPICTESLE